MVIVDLSISFRGFDIWLNCGVLGLMIILYLIYFLRHEGKAKIVVERQTGGGLLECGLPALLYHCRLCFCRSP